MKHLCLGCIASAIIAILSISLTAEDEKQKPKKKPKPKKIVAATLKDVDQDFAVQGEYEGSVNGKDGKQKIGIQIRALGHGEFEAVAHHGGLPGAGWDGKEKTKARGKTIDGKTVMTADPGTATVVGRILTIRNSDGEEVGKLEKVTRKSPTLGKKAPEGAVVLFNGKSPDQFKNGKMTKDGLLMQGCRSIKTFQDFTLHMEFRLPYQPNDRGQGRANSGCYLQGRYEVQVLDSFALEGKHNECGGIYETRDPDVNMCFSPLVWQTYDIDFTAAKYTDGKKTADAKITVRHNGVIVHKDVALPKATRAHPVKESAEPGPIYFQNHGSPVRYRNIWLVEN